jgi:hypothetical protein
MGWVVEVESPNPPVEPITWGLEPQYAKRSLIVVRKGDGPKKITVLMMDQTPTEGVSVFGVSCVDF